jgi:glycolate oxidase FAD binding subunit
MNPQMGPSPTSAASPDPGLGRIREQVAAAIAARRPLRLLGASTKAFLGGGRGAGDEPLDCTQTRGIVDYEPSELFVTVRAGTPLAELQAALDERRQFLPFEPPTFDGRATVGGMVACGLSGPRRATAGGLRDYVLGTVVLDGRNRLMRFGGQVMKNVAGYDVSRLLAGSFGWLGVIAEVSLKVLPKPAHEVTLVQELTAAQAIRRFNEWGGKPLPVSATSWNGGRAHVRLSGSEVSVIEAAARIGGERFDPSDAARWWEDLREQRHAYFRADHPLWRLSLSPTTAPLELGAPQWIEWGGALRWCALPVAAATPRAVRDAAADVGGTAAIHRLPSPVPQAYAEFPRLPALSPVVARIHERLKDAFDPHRIFGRGAMPGLDH